MNPINRIIVYIINKACPSRAKKPIGEVSKPKTYTTGEIRQISQELLPSHAKHLTNTEFDEPYKSKALNKTVESNGRKVKISYLTSMPGHIEGEAFIPHEDYLRAGIGPIKSDDVMKMITSTDLKDIEVVELVNEIIANVFAQAKEVTGEKTIDGIAFAGFKEEGACSANPIVCSDYYISGIFREIANYKSIFSPDYINEKAMELRSALIHEMSHQVKDGLKIDFVDFPEINRTKMQEAYNKGTEEERRVIKQYMKKGRADEFPVWAIEFIHTLDHSNQSLNRYEGYFFETLYRGKNEYLYTAAAFNSFKLVRSALIRCEHCPNKPRNSSPGELIKSIKSIPEKERTELINQLTKEWLSGTIKELYETCKDLPPEKF